MSSLDDLFVIYANLFILLRIFTIRSVETNNVFLKKNIIQVKR